MTTQNGRAFNEWLRAQLKAKKMSQRQLAQQSGVDHSTISRLIRGDRMPSLGTATKLARGLRELREDADTAAVPRPRRRRRRQPDGSRRVRPAGGRDASRAAGPPDHGVLPRRPDAPLRPRVPAVRARRPAARRSARSRAPQPLGAGPVVAGVGPAMSRMRPESPGRADRWAGPIGRRPGGPRPRPATITSPGHDPDRPPRPGLGDSERRRLGRRRSHVRAALDADGLVGGCGPRSRASEPARSGARRRLALDAHPGKHRSTLRVSARQGSSPSGTLGGP